MRVVDKGAVERIVMEDRPVGRWAVGTLSHQCQAALKEQEKTH